MCRFHGLILADVGFGVKGVGCECLSVPFLCKAGWCRGYVGRENTPISGGISLLSRLRGTETAVRLHDAA